MQYDDLPESSNVEDRRAEGGHVGGGFGGMPGGVGGLSIGTIVVLGLVGWALGIDPSFLIGGAEMLTREQPRVESPGQKPSIGGPANLRAATRVNPEQAPKGEVASCRPDPNAGKAGALGGETVESLRVARRGSGGGT